MFSNLTQEFKTESLLYTGFFKQEHLNQLRALSYKL